VKVAAVAAAECMGATALVLQMVRLPEHRPFTANIFCFFFVPLPFY